MVPAGWVAGELAGAGDRITEYEPLDEFDTRVVALGGRLDPTLPIGGHEAAARPARGEHQPVGVGPRVGEAQIDHLEERVGIGRPGDDVDRAAAPFGVEGVADDVVVVRSAEHQHGEGVGLTTDRIDAATRNTMG